MADPYEPRSGDAGAPRPSQTGSVPIIGFDDPSLRPLPSDRMDYHIPHPDAHPERHEHSDVPIRPLAISLAAIAVTLTLMFWFLYVLFFHYKGEQEALELKRTNVPEARPPVPGPRLQAVPGFNDKHPKEDMKDLREVYREELEGYGKTADGFARVPVERAMEMALQQGIFKTSGQARGNPGDGSQPPPQSRPQSPPQAPPSQSPPRGGGAR